MNILLLLNPGTILRMPPTSIGKKKQERGLRTSKSEQQQQQQQQRPVRPISLTLSTSLHSLFLPSFLLLLLFILGDPPRVRETLLVRMKKREREREEEGC